MLPFGIRPNLMGKQQDMSLFYSRKLTVLPILLIGLSFLFQCCGKFDAISLGDSREVFGVASIDTFTVDTQVALLDPLPTAGAGSLLIGKLTDDRLGDTRISSYIRFTLPDLSTELASDVRYDSLSLHLSYSGYSYGDTTQDFSFSVYELDEGIEPVELPIALEDDEYPVFASGKTLFSDQSFRVKPNKIGQLTFRPQPQQTSDTIKVRINDTLGRALFRLVQNKDSKIVNLDEFVEYLKGIVLVPEASDKAVLGLRDSISLTIHCSYEEQADGSRRSAQIHIPASDGSYTYHQAETDRSGSLLGSLSYNEPLSASTIGNLSFVQGLTGVVTQLRVPYVNAFIKDGTRYINKAELVIEAKPPSSVNRAVPDSLILMKSNKYGTPTSLIQYSSGGVISAYYRSDDLAGGNTKGSYTFNITDLVSSWAYKGAYREDEGLLVSLPLNKLFSTVDQLEIPSNNGRPAIKLIITYTKLNENEMFF